MINYTPVNSQAGEQRGTLAVLASWHRDHPGHDGDGHFIAGTLIVPDIQYNYKGVATKTTPVNNVHSTLRLVN